jgi:hypothetical protein
MLLYNEEVQELVLFTKEKKSTSVTDHRGPEGCEMLRIPHFLDSRLIDGG